MRKLLASVLLAVCALAHAGADDINFSQRNSTDSGNVNRIPAHPVTPGLLSYNSASLLPEWVTLGAGLSINGGVLASVVPVNPDWNATSGLAQILNKPAIPAAQVNSDWNATSGVSAILNKPAIPGAFNFGVPSARTLPIGTAFQANDPTKASLITVSPQCSAQISISGGSTCTLQARVGTSGLTCNSGTVVAQWTNGNTGTLTVGLLLNQIVGAPATLHLPIGASAILCPVSGTFTVPVAVDQSAG